MAEQKDKNKKRKKEKIVAGLIASTALVGGAIAGGISTIPKTEEENEEEKKNSCTLASTNPQQKKSLSDEITVLWLNVLFDASKKNHELNSEILNDILLTHWLESTKLTNPTIEYFSDEQGKNNISEQNQKPGNLYVVITAANDDPNYQGSTNPFKTI